MADDTRSGTPETGPAEEAGEAAAAYARERGEEEAREGVPAEWRTFHLAAHAPAGAPAKPPVLLLHGTTGTTADVAHLGRALQRAGHAVLAPLFPGHGRGEAALGDLRWEACLAEARRAWRAVRVEAGPARGPGVSPGSRASETTAAILAGYSFGGLIAMQLAVETPPGALLLLAAYVHPVLRLHHRIARLFLPLWRPMAPPLLRWKAQLLGLTPLALDALPRIACPTFIAQGLDDPTVAPRSAQTIAARIGAREKRVLRLPGVAHDLLAAEGGGEVEREVLDFLSSIPPESA